MDNGVSLGDSSVYLPILTSSTLFNLNDPSIQSTFRYIDQTPDLNPESTNISKLHILSVDHYDDIPTEAVILPTIPTSPQVPTRKRQVVIQRNITSHGIRYESWFSPRYLTTLFTSQDALDRPHHLIHFTVNLSVCSNNTILVYYTEYRPNGQPISVMRCVRWFSAPDKKISSISAYQPYRNNSIADALERKVARYQMGLDKLRQFGHTLFSNHDINRMTGGGGGSGGGDSSCNPPPTHPLPSIGTDTTSPSRSSCHQPPPPIPTSIAPPTVCNLKTLSDHISLTSQAQVLSSESTDPSHHQHEQYEHIHPLSHHVHTINERHHGYTALVDNTTTTPNGILPSSLAPNSHDPSTIAAMHASYHAHNSIHHGYYYTIGCEDGSSYVLPLSWVLGSSSLSSLSSSSSPPPSLPSSLSSSPALVSSPGDSAIHHHGDNDKEPIHNLPRSTGQTQQTGLQFIPYTPFDPLLTHLCAVIASSQSVNSFLTMTPLLSGFTPPTTEQPQIMHEVHEMLVQLLPRCTNHHASKQLSPHLAFVMAYLIYTPITSWLHPWYLFDDIASPMLSNPLAPQQITIGTADDHVIESLNEYFPALFSKYFYDPFDSQWMNHMSHLQSSSGMPSDASTTATITASTQHHHHMSPHNTITTLFRQFVEGSFHPFQAKPSPQPSLSSLSTIQSSRGASPLAYSGPMLSTPITTVTTHHNADNQIDTIDPTLFWSHYGQPHFAHLYKHIRFGDGTALTVSDEDDLSQSLSPRVSTLLYNIIHHIHTKIDTCDTYEQAIAMLQVKTHEDIRTILPDHCILWRRLRAQALLLSPYGYFQRFIQHRSSTASSSSPPSLSTSATTLAGSLLSTSPDLSRASHIQPASGSTIAGGDAEPTPISPTILSHQDALAASRANRITPFFNQSILIDDATTTFFDSPSHDLSNNWRDQANSDGSLLISSLHMGPSLEADIRDLYASHSPQIDVQPHVVSHILFWQTFYGELYYIILLSSNLLVFLNTTTLEPSCIDLNPHISLPIVSIELIQGDTFSPCPVCRDSLLHTVDGDTHHPSIELHCYDPIHQLVSGCDASPPSSSSSLSPLRIHLGSSPSQVPHPGHLFTNPGNMVIPPNLACSSCLILQSQRNLTKSLLIKTINGCAFILQLESRRALPQDLQAVIVNITSKMLTRALSLLDIHSRHLGLPSAFFYHNMAGDKDASSGITSQNVLVPFPTQIHSEGVLSTSHTHDHHPSSPFHHLICPPSTPSPNTLSSHDPYVASLLAKLKGIESPTVDQLLHEPLFTLWSPCISPSPSPHGRHHTQSHGGDGKHTKGSSPHPLMGGGMSGVNRDSLSDFSSSHTCDELIADSITNTLQYSYDGITVPSSAFHEHPSTHHLSPSSPRVFHSSVSYGSHHGQQDHHTGTDSTVTVSLSSSPSLLMYRYHLSLPFDYPLFQEQYDQLIQDPSSTLSRMVIPPSLLSTHSSPSGMGNPPPRERSSLITTVSSPTSPPPSSPRALKPEHTPTSYDPWSDPQSHSFASNPASKVTLQEVLLILQMAYTMHFDNILSSSFTQVTDSTLDRSVDHLFLPVQTIEGIHRQRSEKQVVKSKALSSHPTTPSQVSNESTTVIRSVNLPGSNRTTTSHIITPPSIPIFGILNAPSVYTMSRPAGCKISPIDHSRLKPTPFSKTQSSLACPPYLYYYNLPLYSPLFHQQMVFHSLVGISPRSPRDVVIILDSLLAQLTSTDLDDAQFDLQSFEHYLSLGYDVFDNYIYQQYHRPMKLSRQRRHRTHPGDHHGRALPSASLRDQPPHHHQEEDPHTALRSISEKHSLPSSPQQPPLDIDPFDDSLPMLYPLLPQVLMGQITNHTNILRESISSMTSSNHDQRPSSLLRDFAGLVDTTTSQSNINHSFNHSTSTNMMGGSTGMTHHLPLDENIPTSVIVLPSTLHRYYTNGPIDGTLLDKSEPKASGNMILFDGKRLSFTQLSQLSNLHYRSPLHPWPIYNRKWRDDSTLRLSFPFLSLPFAEWCLRQHSTSHIPYNIPLRKQFEYWKLSTSNHPLPNFSTFEHENFTLWTQWMKREKTIWAAFVQYQYTYAFHSSKHFREFISGQSTKLKKLQQHHVLNLSYPLIFETPYLFNLQLATFHYAPSIAIAQTLSQPPSILQSPLPMVLPMQRHHRGDNIHRDDGNHRHHDHDTVDIGNQHQSGSKQEQVLSSFIPPNFHASMLQVSMTRCNGHQFIYPIADSELFQHHQQGDDDMESYHHGSPSSPTTTSTYFIFDADDPSRLRNPIPDKWFYGIDGHYLAFNEKYMVVASPWVQSSSHHRDSTCSTELTDGTIVSVVSMEYHSNTRFHFGYSSPMVSGLSYPQDRSITTPHLQSMVIPHRIRALSQIPTGLASSPLFACPYPPHLNHSPEQSHHASPPVCLPAYSAWSPDAVVYLGDGITPIPSLNGHAAASPLTSAATPNATPDAPCHPVVDLFYNGHSHLGYHYLYLWYGLSTTHRRNRPYWNQSPPCVLTLPITRNFNTVCFQTELHRYLLNSVDSIIQLTSSFYTDQAHAMITLDNPSPLPYHFNCGSIPDNYSPQHKDPAPAPAPGGSFVNHTGIGSSTHAIDSIYHYLHTLFHLPLIQQLSTPHLHEVHQILEQDVFTSTLQPSSSHDAVMVHTILKLLHRTLCTIREAMHRLKTHVETYSHLCSSSGSPVDPSLLLEALLNVLQGCHGLPTVATQLQYTFLLIRRSSLIGEPLLVMYCIFLIGCEYYHTISSLQSHLPLLTQHTIPMHVDTLIDCHGAVPLAISMMSNLFMQSVELIWHILRESTLPQTPTLPSNIATPSSSSSSSTPNRGNGTGIGMSVPSPKPLHVSISGNTQFDGVSSSTPSLFSRSSQLSTPSTSFSSNSLQTKDNVSSPSTCLSRISTPSYQRTLSDDVQSLFTHDNFSIDAILSLEPLQYHPHHRHAPSEQQKNDQKVDNPFYIYSYGLQAASVIFSRLEESSTTPLDTNHLPIEHHPTYILSHYPQLLEFSQAMPTVTVAEYISLQSLLAVSIKQCVSLQCHLATQQPCVEQNQHHPTDTQTWQTWHEACIRRMQYTPFNTTQLQHEEPDIIHTLQRNTYYDDVSANTVILPTDDHHHPSPASSILTTLLDENPRLGMTGYQLALLAKYYQHCRRYLLGFSLESGLEGDAPSDHHLSQHNSTANPLNRPSPNSSGVGVVNWFAYGQPYLSKLRLSLLQSLYIPIYQLLSARQRGFSLSYSHVLYETYHYLRSIGKAPVSTSGKSIFLPLPQQQSSKQQQQQQQQQGLHSNRPTPLSMGVFTPLFNLHQIEMNHIALLYDQRIPMIESITGHQYPHIPSLSLPGQRPSSLHDVPGSSVYASDLPSPMPGHPEHPHQMRPLLTTLPPQHFTFSSISLKLGLLYNVSNKAFNSTNSSTTTTPSHDDQHSTPSSHDLPGLMLDSLIHSLYLVMSSAFCSYISFNVLRGHHQLQRRAHQRLIAQLNLTKRFQVNNAPSSSSTHSQMEDDDPGRTSAWTPILQALTSGHTPSCLSTIAYHSAMYASALSTLSAIHAASAPVFLFSSLLTSVHTPPHQSKDHAVHKTPSHVPTTILQAVFTRMHRYIIPTFNLLLASQPHPPLQSYQANTQHSIEGICSNIFIQLALLVPTLHQSSEIVKRPRRTIDPNTIITPHGLSSFLYEGESHIALYLHPDHQPHPASSIPITQDHHLQSAPSTAISQRCSIWVWASIVSTMFTTSVNQLVEMFSRYKSSMFQTLLSSMVGYLSLGSPCGSPTSALHRYVPSSPAQPHPPQQRRSPGDDNDSRVALIHSALHNLYVSFSNRVGVYTLFQHPLFTHIATPQTRIDLLLLGLQLITAHTEDRHQKVSDAIKRQSTEDVIPFSTGDEYGDVLAMDDTPQTPLPSSEKLTNDTIHLMDSQNMLNIATLLMKWSLPNTPSTYEIEFGQGSVIQLTSLMELDQFDMSFAPFSSPPPPSSSSSSSSSLSLFDQEADTFSHLPWDEASDNLQPSDDYDQVFSSFYNTLHAKLGVPVGRQVAKDYTSSDPSPNSLPPPSVTTDVVLSPQLLQTIHTHAYSHQLDKDCESIGDEHASQSTFTTQIHSLPYSLHVHTTVLFYMKHLYTTLSSVTSISTLLSVLSTLQPPLLSPFCTTTLLSSPNCDFEGGSVQQLFNNQSFDLTSLQPYHADAIHFLLKKKRGVFTTINQSTTHHLHPSHSSSYENNQDGCMDYYHLYANANAEQSSDRNPTTHPSSIHECMIAAHGMSPYLLRAVSSLLGGSQSMAVSQALCFEVISPHLDAPSYGLYVNIPHHGDGNDTSPTKATTATTVTRPWFKTGIHSTLRPSNVYQYQSISPILLVELYLYAVIRYVDTLYKDIGSHDTFTSHNDGLFGCPIPSILPSLLCEYAGCYNPTTIESFLRMASYIPNTVILILPALQGNMARCFELLVEITTHDMSQYIHAASSHIIPFQIHQVSPWLNDTLSQEVHGISTAVVTQLLESIGCLAVDMITHAIAPYIKLLFTYILRYAQFGLITTLGTSVPSYGSNIKALLTLSSSASPPSTSLSYQEMYQTLSVILAEFNNILKTSSLTRSKNHSLSIRNSAPFDHFIGDLESSCSQLMQLLMETQDTIHETVCRDIQTSLVDVTNSDHHCTIQHILTISQHTVVRGVESNACVRQFLSQFSTLMEFYHSFLPMKHPTGDMSMDLPLGPGTILCFLPSISFYVIFSTHAQSTPNRRVATAISSYYTSTFTHLIALQRTFLRPPSLAWYNSTPLLPLMASRMDTAAHLTSALAHLSIIPHPHGMPPHETSLTTASSFDIFHHLHPHESPLGDHAGNNMMVTLGIQMSLSDSSNGHIISRPAHIGTTTQVGPMLMNTRPTSLRTHAGALPNYTLLSSSLNAIPYHEKALGVLLPSGRVQLLSDFICALQHFAINLSSELPNIMYSTRLNVDDFRRLYLLYVYMFVMHLRDLILTYCLSYAGSSPAQAHLPAPVITLLADGGIPQELIPQISMAIAEYITNHSIES